MKVLFFIVNYKADDYLLKLIQSIQESAAMINPVEVCIYVLDNSMKQEADSEVLRQQLNLFGLNVKLLNSPSNKGYFGGLPFAQELVDNSFDFLIYCNPDIRLETDFFEKLGRTNKKKARVVAPAIILEGSNINENPKYPDRIKKSKLVRLKFIYSNVLFFGLFNTLAYLYEILLSFRKKTGQEKEETPLKIYAPHGAMFVFSDIAFFKRLPPYPCFLFGEELFIAEEAAKSNVEVWYEPSVRVKDSRHASISLLKMKERQLLYLSSIEYILEKYY